MIPSFVFKIYKKRLKKHSIFNLPHKDIFIVLGAARTGTSLIMELLKESGIFIGHVKDLKKPDESNPRGYFEHSKAYKITSDLLQQASQKRNLFKKLKRLITRVQMNKFLKRIHSQSKDSWALKLHSDALPLWQSHIPDFKLILVYRHPLIMAHSNIKLKNFKMPFDKYISRWEDLYREYIYYYGRYPSIVINYDDLVNPDKRDKLLSKLIEFTGRGNLNNLKKVITADLNRSSKEISKLMDIYPLPETTWEILGVLEKIKA